MHPAKSWDLKRVGWSWHSERFTLHLSMRLSPQSFAVGKTSVRHQLGLSCSSPRHPPACSGPSTGVPSPLPSSTAFPAASGTQSLFAVVFHLQTKKDVLRFVIKQEGSTLRPLKTGHTGVLPPSVQEGRDQRAVIYLPYN